MCTSIVNTGNVLDMFRFLICGCSLFLPNVVKRPLLRMLLGFEIHPSARIGIAWLGMKHLRMEKNARIGHLNIFKNVDSVDLKEHSSIGRMNLFTCVPTSDTRHYAHLLDRKTEFRLGVHSHVTMRHLFDCNAPIVVGDFVTIAGYGSQFLTHSIDIEFCRQDARPIIVDEFSFVGTGCILLAGAKLPARSVLGAGAVLTSTYEETESLYAGVPAKFKKRLPVETKYWKRDEGWIA